MSILNFFLIFINTLILVSGQFLWKFGLMGRTNSYQSIEGVIKLFLSPYIISGLFLYGAATVLWLFILTRVPLSLAYPIQSMAYIFAVFGAYFIFNEPLTIWKIIGVLLIMAGVSLIGITGNS
jgi:drug/metabolite transporter (DMT)-like permease